MATKELLSVIVLICSKPCPVTDLVFLVLETPILGAKLPMRRETLKAIEHARDNLIRFLSFNYIFAYSLNFLSIKD